MKNAMGIMLDRHRERGVMCPPSCFCWDVDGYLVELEAVQQSAQRAGLTAEQFSEFMKNYVTDILAQVRKTPRPIAGNANR